MKGTRNIIVASSLFISVFLLLIVFMVAPQIRGIVKDAENFLSQRKEVAKNMEEQKNIRDFQVFSAAHHLDINRSRDLLIDPQDPTRFLVFLENMAAESGFALKIVPGNPQKIKEDPYSSIPFQISSEGSSANLRSFFQKLEYAPYLIEIKDLTVRVQRSSALKDNSIFSFSLKVYTK